MFSYASSTLKNTSKNKFRQFTSQQYISFHQSQPNTISRHFISYSSSSNSYGLKSMKTPHKFQYRTMSTLTPEEMQKINTSAEINAQREKIKPVAQISFDKSGQSTQQIHYHHHHHHYYSDPKAIPTSLKGKPLQELAPGYNYYYHFESPTAIEVIPAITTPTKRSSSIFPMVFMGLILAGGGFAWYKKEQCRALFFAKRDIIQQRAEKLQSRMQQHQDTLKQRLDNAGVINNDGNIDNTKAIEWARYKLQHKRDKFLARLPEGTDMTSPEFLQRFDNQMDIYTSQIQQRVTDGSWKRHFKRNCDRGDSSCHKSWNPFKGCHGKSACHKSSSCSTGTCSTVDSNASSHTNVTGDDSGNNQPNVDSAVDVNNDQHHHHHHKRRHFGHKHDDQHHSDKKGWWKRHSGDNNNQQQEVQNVVSENQNV